MRPVCHGHTAQTGEIQSWLNDGKNLDQVLAAFVEKYGQAVLAVPRNTGFNALAWLLPYAMGALGLVMIRADRSPLVVSSRCGGCRRRRDADRSRPRRPSGR